MLPAIVIPIMIAALLTVPVTTLYVFFRAYVMPTGSMEQTLLIGDHLVVRTRGIGPVQRGEIVVFHYPVDPRPVFIKRVSGVPGDRLKLVNKQLYLNGGSRAGTISRWTAATGASSTAARYAANPSSSTCQLTRRRKAGPIASSNASNEV